MLQGHRRLPLRHVLRHAQLISRPFLRTTFYYPLFFPFLCTEFLNCAVLFLSTHTHTHMHMMHAASLLASEVCYREER